MLDQGHRPMRFEQRKKRWTRTRAIPSRRRRRHAEYSLDSAAEQALQEP